MAPKNPVYSDSSVEHPTYEQAGAYYNAFSSGNEFEPLRPIDILTEDENSNVVTDVSLSEDLLNRLIEDGFDCRYNEPYANNTKYMMNHYLKIIPGTAIDIPKHLLTDQSLSDFRLDKFDLDHIKCKKLATVIANSVLKD